MLTHHQALIHGMVVMAAADAVMTEAEMDMIGRIVVHLPVFRDFDLTELPDATDACIAKLDSENGIEEILTEIKTALPAGLRETAYALAVEVAAADLEASNEELVLLQMLRQSLELDRLICTGIERGVRARFTVV